MKKFTYILLIITLTSCTITKKPRYYPDSMMIDTKIKQGKEYHYLDGNYDFHIKQKRFNEGDIIYFKKIGKKYLLVKKCKE